MLCDALQALDAEPAVCEFAKARRNLILRALGALGRALAQNPAVLALADFAGGLLGRMYRRLARLLGDFFYRLGGLLDRAAAALYRRIGRPVTLGLAGVGFLAALLPPEHSGIPVGPNWMAEADCLALNIYHEARNEPDTGKLAVGHVVINRMFDPRFPATVCGVVEQGGENPNGGCQFSWRCDGKDDEPRNMTAWKDSRFHANRILAGRIKDPTYGALWYHADYVDPPWRYKLSETTQIGRHTFYMDP